MNLLMVYDLLGIKISNIIMKYYNLLKCSYTFLCYQISKIKISP